MELAEVKCSNCMLEPRPKTDFSVGREALLWRKSKTLKFWNQPGCLPFDSCGWFDIRYNYLLERLIEEWGQAISVDCVLSFSAESVVGC
jgi:hypothetical protein